MQKIIAILIVTTVLCGCSVSRKNSVKTTNEGANFNKVTLEDVEKLNLTNSSFYIEKMEFNLKDVNGSQSGLGSVKFIKPDKFLITIKSRTGIEVARIFITSDTVVINDRINKKLYYGSNGYLKSKYGITTSVLPVLFGDYVNDMDLKSGTEDCIKGLSKIQGSVNKIQVLYVLDCALAKIVKAIPGNSGGESGLQIYYSDFFMQQDLTVPGKIEISDTQKRSVIELRIKKVELNWDGEIEFIPGKQYEKIHLL